MTTTFNPSSIGNQKNSPYFREHSIGEQIPDHVPIKRMPQNLSFESTAQELLKSLAPSDRNLPILEEILQDHYECMKNAIDNLASDEDECETFEKRKESIEKFKRLAKDHLIDEKTLEIILDNLLAKEEMLSVESQRIEQSTMA